jgi:prevent-host-death family protein
MEVNIHEAKTHLSRLLQRVIAGEEITIARAGVPVARLVAVERPPSPRPMGMDRGRFTVPQDFNDPLPDDLLALFYGEEPKPDARAKKKRRPSRRKSRTP